MRNRETGKKKRIWPELLFALLILSAMLAVRVNYMDGAVIDGGGFYNLARVTMEHKAAYLEYAAGDLYVKLLHLTFWMFGNQMLFGAYLQFGLQTAALLLFYFTLRKLSGWIPALAVQAAFIVFPQFLRPLVVLNQTQLFLLVWCLNLFLTAVLLQNKQGGLSPRKLLLHITAGTLGGFSLCLDKMYGLLLVLCIVLILLKKESGRVQRGFSYLTGIGAGAVLSLFVKAQLYGMGLKEVWQEYKRVQLEEPLFYSGSVMNYIPELLTLMIFIVAAVIFVVAGYLRKDAEDAAEKQELQIENIEEEEGTEAESGSGRQGKAVETDISKIDRIAKNRTTKTEKKHRKEILPQTEEGMKESAGDKDRRGQEEQQENAETSKPKINYIENPLPLPRPHVKKSMDYAFEPKPSQMKYDIEIEQDDDFDIT